MKNFKMLIALLAIVFAVGSAFKAAPAKQSSTLSYFQFLGNAADFNQYKDSNKWQLTDIDGEGCSFGDVPCVVYSDTYSDITNFVNAIQSDENVVTQHLQSEKM
ncbi:MAG: hypothetical protein JWN76_2348 [Chitinophagaceae bacterium]|nr:hypothetical protein [Chitinophagaceae bacterium]